MELQIRDRFFVVTGAGSGFGRAVAETLLAEGAHVLAVARTQSVLEAFKSQAGPKLDIITGDITQDIVQKELFERIKNEYVSGVLVNAGGPPAKAFMETNLQEWDEAYRSLLRWKVAFAQELTRKMMLQNYGRLLFIESVSVKQPVDNLVLSNSLRAAVVGFVKSLSRDVAKQDITLNVMAPGYHNTAAMKRLFDKKADMQKITTTQAREAFEQLIPMGKLGEAADLATLAVWLLSPLSRYVTGQTFSHDGGVVSGLFG